MIDLEEQFRKAPSERSLLLTYSVGLGHVEREILPHLLAAGERSEVVVLCDARQYAETFAEAAAITGPGVNYRLHPVQLSAGTSAFHPKLYVLLSAEEATVLVGSSNLTLFGCRSNAEVVERLHLSAREDDDASAISNVAAFLLAIPDLAGSLPCSAANSIREIAAELARRTTACAATDHVRFLHNTHRPLLPQLTDALQAERVRRVYAVSPFFDAQGRALRALREAYPQADFQVVTSAGAAGTLAGDQVAAWPNAPALQIYTSLGGDRSRALHAKLYVLVTDRGAWTLIGSPNLSAPALLRSAQGGGNLECAVLRFWPDPARAEALLGTLDREAGSWPQLLHRASETESVAQDAPGHLHVGGAERLGRLLRLHFHPSAPLSGASMSVRVSLRSGPVERPCRVGRDPEGMWTAEASLENPVPIHLPDEPVVIGVEVVTATGEHLVGRAWLSQPHLLERSNWQRRATGLALSYGQSGNMGDEEALAFADTLVHLAAELAGAQLRPQGASGLTGENKAPATGRNHGVETEELVQEGEHRPGAEGLSAGSRRVLDQILQALAGWRPTEEGLDEWEGDEDPEQHAGERRSTRPPSSRRRPGYRPTTIHQLRQRLQRSLQVWTQTKPAPGNVADVADMIEARSRGVLDFALDALRTGKLEPGRQLAEVMLDGLRVAFSLSGIEEGRPAGWFVRAAANDDTRSAVHLAMSEPARYGALAAHLGALYSLAGWLNLSVAGGIAPLLAGLRVVADRPDVFTAADLAGHLADEAARIAARAEGLVTETEIVDALSAADREVRESSLVRAARWWAPVLSHDGRRYRSDEGTPAQVEKLLARLQGRTAVPLIPLTIRSSGAHCGGCGTRLPEQARQHLEGLKILLHPCDGCRKFVIPFAHGEEITRRVLSLFLSDLEVRSP